MKSSDLQVGKSELENKTCDLRNLIFYLEKIFDLLNIFKDKNLILPIGYTGCGKSTLITSLVFGPESLEKKAIVRQVTKMNSLGGQ